MPLGCLLVTFIEVMLLNALQQVVNAQRKFTIEWWAIPKVPDAPELLDMKQHYQTPKKIMKVV